MMGACNCSLQGSECCDPCDCSGPPGDPREVLDVFDIVRSQYPGATVIASSLDAFVEEVLAARHFLNMTVVSGTARPQQT